MLSWFKKKTDKTPIVVILISVIVWATWAGYDLAKSHWIGLGLDSVFLAIMLVGLVVTRLKGEKNPVEEIVDQLNEPRPLPLGRKEFEEWTQRLITGAMLPSATDEDSVAFYKSQQYALANMIMHLGPTESHKPDAHFIHQLRKVACNQVAHSMLMEIKKDRDERVAAEAAQTDLKVVENT